MADLGFDQISIEPVVSLPDEPYAIKEEDIPYLLDQYDILAKEMIKRHKEGRGFNFFHFMIDLTGDHAWPNVCRGVVQVQNICQLHHGATFIRAISLSVRMGSASEM